MRLELTIQNLEIEYEVELTGIPGYVTTAEAAQMLGVTQGRVQQLVADGVLESVLMGRTRLIPVAAVQARLKSKPPTGRPRKIGGKP